MDRNHTLTTAEQWRPVAGYEGVYEVSDAGRIRSLPRRGSSGGLLRPALSQGYLVVNLRARGTSRVRPVHQLVAEAFLGPRPNGQDTRHLDGNALNNAVTNLAYGSRSENCHDLVTHGTHNNARKTHCAKGHEYTAGNTRTIPSRPSARYCRTCEAARGRGRGIETTGAVA